MQFTKLLIHIQIRINNKIALNGTERIINKSNLRQELFILVKLMIKKTKNKKEKKKEKKKRKEKKTNKEKKK